MTGTSSFESSDYHNIAYIDSKEEKISFKFANNLTKGDTLVSFPEKGQKVKRIIKNQERKGLFSPYTKYNNYFIYHEHYEPD